MLVVYLEVGLALTLAVLIVWWTWPKKKRSEDKPIPDGNRDARRERGEDDQ